jgi:hypothetical protein
MVEPPRISHKKKTDRDRERERLEKDLALQFEQDYRRSQVERGRPIYPREALKRTADNKWVHVTCALWTPEVRFSKATALEVAEGIPLIPRIRREQICKLCKTSNGACISCHHCHVSFHIACAYRANYIFGYDVNPVKGSRREGVSIVKLGEETGTLTAGIWCKEHSAGAIKGTIHYLNELVDEKGKIALQLFAENYKQADLTLTGTARKANYLDEITKSTTAVVANGPNRRISTAPVAGGRSSRNSIAGANKEPETPDGDVRMASPEHELPARKCSVCKIDVSPRWWKHEIVKPAPAVQPPSNPLPNGLAINGLSHDHRDPNRMDIDGPQLLNGHGLGPSIGGRSLMNGVGPELHVPQPAGVIEVQYDCNKCHWRRINDPENLHKSKDPESAPAVEPIQSPPRPVGFHGRPPPLPLSLHQPPHQPAWPPFANGGAGSPPGPMHLSTHHHNSLPPPHHHGVQAAPPQHNGPSSFAPPPSIHRGSFMTPGQVHAPPNAGPAPIHAIQQHVPNGLPSPHAQPSPRGPPPMRSPTHPPPGLPSSHHRPSDVGFGGPPPPAGPQAPYSHHAPSGLPRHGFSGSPDPRPSGPPPSLPSAALSNGPRPSTPRDTPVPQVGPRMPHGASASPNVRNILND